MTKKEITEKVTALVEPTIINNGFEIWNIDYFKDPTGFNLIIEIDRPSSISIDDLTGVNSEINKLLDKADLIPDAYCLEVSSAGLERELKTEKHINQIVGTDNVVKVKLYAPIDGKKLFEGKLKSSDGKEIKLVINDEEKTFSLRDIASLKTEINYN